MSELEFIDELNTELQGVFDEALAARDGAQAAIDHVQRIKARLLQRRIEIQTAMLAERSKES